MTNETALKPCPFCGGKNIDPTFWARNDGKSGPGCDDCSATADSIEAWNTRAPAQGEPADIFQECAEIALEHVEAYPYGTVAIWGKGYDEACRDIAEAIKLRAANRKTMDAIADRKDDQS